MLQSSVQKSLPQHRRTGSGSGSVLGGIAGFANRVHPIGEAAGGEKNGISF
jgi:hypothetical protein